MMRLAHILVAIAVVLSIFLTGCAEEQELDVEDLRDRLSSYGRRPLSAGWAFSLSCQYVCEAIP
jgi:hypothetical protein